jgi:hypothetical protein
VRLQVGIEACVLRREVLTLEAAVTRTRRLMPDLLSPALLY